MPHSCWELVGLHSPVPRGAKVLLLHLSVLLVRSVLHQCAASRDTCLHGFISRSLPLLPAPGRAALSAGTCLWLRAANQGVVPAPRAAPWGSWMPWLLLCLAGPSQPSTQCWVAQLAGHLKDAAVGHKEGCGQVKSTHEPRLNIFFSHDLLFLLFFFEFLSLCSTNALQLPFCGGKHGWVWWFQALGKTYI